MCDVWRILRLFFYIIRFFSSTDQFTHCHLQNVYIPDTSTRWLHIYIWFYFIYSLKNALLLHLLSQNSRYGNKNKWNIIWISLALVNACGVCLCMMRCTSKCWMLSECMHTKRSRAQMHHFLGCIVTFIHRTMNSIFYVLFSILVRNAVCGINILVCKCAALEIVNWWSLGALHCIAMHCLCNFFSSFFRLKNVHRARSNGYCL